MACTAVLDEAIHQSGVKVGVGSLGVEKASAGVFFPPGPRIFV